MSSTTLRRSLASSHSRVTSGQCTALLTFSKSCAAVGAMVHTRETSLSSASDSSSHVNSGTGLLLVCDFCGSHLGPLPWGLPEACSKCPHHVTGCLVLQSALCFLSLAGQSCSITCADHFAWHCRQSILCPERVSFGIMSFGIMFLYS